MFDPIDDHKSMNSKPTKTNVSSNLVSSLPSKTTLSVVDKILLKESSSDKHSKTGSINNAKQLQLNSVSAVYLQG